MTNPDNVGGLIEKWRAKARTCAKIGDHQEAGVYRTCAFQLGQLCRAAPAGGDVERFSPDCEPCSDFESWVGCMRPDPNGNWVRAVPAGGECQHEWQPDADVMNARYCPKCDVTQTIPRKSVKPPAPIGLLYEQLRAEIDGGSESMTHEDALQWVRDVRDSAPAGSGEVEDIAASLERMADDDCRGNDEGGNG